MYKYPKAYHVWYQSKAFFVSRKMAISILTINNITLVNIEYACSLSSYATYMQHICVCQ